MGLINKKLTLTFLFLATALPSFSQLASGDTYADAIKNKKAKLTVAYLEEDAFAYPDEKGTPQGVEIDIFNQFIIWLRNSKKIIVTPEYVAEPSFQKFYSDVQNGGKGVVGLGTVTILERRKSEVKFSPAWINNIAVLVTHSSAADLEKLENISRTYSDKKALVARGTTLEGYIKELKEKYYPSLEIEYVESQMEVVQKVADDPSYFAYMDLSVYWPAYDKQKLPVKRQAVGDLSSETFGFIMPLSSDWDEPLQEFFQLGRGYRSNPAYQSILMKHLGVEVTKMLQLAQMRDQK